MGYLDYAGLQYLWGKLKEKFAPKSHTHDDRYYTESEMDGKLNSKVNNNEAGANGLLSKLSVWTATPTDDTYLMRQDTGGGNSFGRVKFSTIWSYIKSKADGVYQPKGSYAASGHTHDDRYYTESEMNTKLAGKSDTNHDHPTSKIVLDNSTNYAGYAGPIEAAHIDVLRANRLAFLPASGIKVEYSTDGGATWTNYGATDDQKASLFAMRMGSGTVFYAGKHTKTAECTAKDQLRVTVTPVDRYASVNMLYLWMTIAGTTATVDIARSTIGAKETFTNVRTDVPISGWSGPNEIRFSQGTFGGGSTQTGNQYSYRFTFKNKADGKGYVSVMDIRMYGPSAWGTANSMMEKDHIYSWDTNQNVSFPAQVTATKFNGSATGVRDYNNDNKIIKIGYNGVGLTKDNLTHIAGYTDDGNKIKDVSRGVLQSWLNLNEMINTQLTTGSNTPSDDDFYIAQYAGGGSTTTTYHRRPVSALWTYIKGKADAIYAAKSHTHTKSQITDFPSSLKNPTSLTIQTNGTTAATYDGSAAKTVNITKGNIGLGNVDNTTDANKSVKYATSAGSATTATKATTADNATMATASKSLQLLSSDRPTSMNFNLGSADYSKKITYSIASGTTKEGKPPRNSLVTTYAWDNSGWGAQVAIDSDSNPRMYVRGATNNNGASKWDANWKTVAFTDDKPATAGTADVANSVDWGKVQNKPSTFTPASHTHPYLPIAGGTMTGDVSFSSIGDTATSKKISWNGSTDGADIYYQTTAADQGNLVINLHDDSNCYLRIAKNGVFKSYFSPDDGNFHGNVNGTADTATSAITSNGVKDYNDANRTIQFGFAGSGLTASNLNYIAGYTDNGTKIKDVSKDVLTSWIGLGNYLPLGGGTMSGQISKSTGGSWIGDRDRATVKSTYSGDSSYGAVAAMATKNGYWTMGNLGGNESLIFNYSTDTNYNTGKNETSRVYLPAQAGTIITSATIGSQSVNYANSAGSATSATNATTATKLSSSAGSNTQPVYFSGGKPVAIGYTIASSVPANAKFTDTTYGVATSSSNGLMSSTDKTKLDDFSKIINIQKQIKLTTDWQDTGISGNSLDTGTYVVQVSGFNPDYTFLWSEMYSGIMTWYSGSTNNTNASEIFLHNAGHADNSNAIYLRTLRTSGGGSLKLQIASKIAASDTDTLTFKFRRLI